MQNDTPIIQIDDLFFHYGQKNVLENIHLSIPKGSFTALVGPNGSGKSTLVKCILGILEAQKGTVNVFGEPACKLKHRERIGYVSQKANSFNSEFPASVFEVVSMGLFAKVGLFKRLNQAQKTRVYEALETVGMAEFAKRNIGELSGGQQQRVFIARALVSDPELMILDEPTVGIDAASVKQFYELLQYLHEKKNITLFMVTHDIGVITDQVTHVICLNQTLHFHGNNEEFKQIQQKGELAKLYGHSVQMLEHQH